MPIPKWLLPPIGITASRSAQAKRRISETSSADFGSSAADGVPPSTSYAESDAVSMAIRSGRESSAKRELREEASWLMLFARPRSQWDEALFLRNPY